jgi:hypothetical protein
MFVTNHVLSGALIGRMLERRPVAAFAVGVASHLALDAVPHWGCDTNRPGGADKFLAAAKRDGVIGLTVMAAATLLATKKTRTATVAAMAGAALLDLDKPMMHFVGRNPFPMRVRRFHEKVQNESEAGLQNEIRFGVGFALADVLLSVLARRRVAPDVAAAGQRDLRLKV